MKPLTLFAAHLSLLFFLGSSVQADTAEEQKQIAILQSNSSSQQKDAACARLKRIGTARAVPALAALLTEEQLSHSARFALESAIAGRAEIKQDFAALALLYQQRLDGVIQLLWWPRLSDKLRDAEACRREAEALLPLLDQVGALFPVLDELRQQRERLEVLHFNRHHESAPPQIEAEITAASAQAQSLIEQLRKTTATLHCPHPDEKITLAAWSTSGMFDPYDSEQVERESAVRVERLTALHDDLLIRLAFIAEKVEAAMA